MKSEVLEAGAIALVLLLAGVLVLSWFFWTPPAARIAMTTATVTSGMHGTLALYKQHVGHYPASLQALITRPTDASKWLGPYLEPDADRLLDAWGNPYLYRAPGVHNPTGYDLWSAGPDGQSDTDDDITNWIPAPAPPVAPTSAPSSRASDTP